MNASVEARKASVVRSGRTLLDGIDFVVPSRRKIALVGPNGSGKTTLLRALAGFVVPQSGEILYDGRALSSWSWIDRARKRSWFGGIEAIEEGRSVAEILWSSRVGASFDEDIPEVAPVAWFELFESWEMSSRRAEEFFAQSVETLSTGELQLVHLARAVLQNSDVLLLDEPTSALDLRHQILVERTLGRLEETKSVVWCVHDLHVALRWADDVYVMDRGKIAASGAVSETLTSETVERVWKVRWDPSGGGKTTISDEKKTV